MEGTHVCGNQLGWCRGSQVTASRSQCRSRSGDHKGLPQAGPQQCLGCQVSLTLSLKAEHPRRPVLCGVWVVGV